MKSTSYKAGLNKYPLPHRHSQKKNHPRHRSRAVIWKANQAYNLLFNDEYSVLSEALLYLKMTGFFQETVNKRNKLSAGIFPRRLHDRQDEKFSLPAYISSG